MTIHIVGLGLSGLATAVRLAETGTQVALYEAAGHAGGRCRSFHDKALDAEIDNGNHLLLSGNARTMAYLDTIGARDEMAVFARAAFKFADLKSGERWQIDLGDGRAPWWLLDRSRRVKGVSVPAHLGAMRILLAGRGATVADAVKNKGALYERFWEPMSIAVLNTRPERGSATLLRRVLVETFGRGGAHARPVIARHSLGRAFVAPALAYLERRGIRPRFHAPLKGLSTNAERVSALHFDSETVPLGPHERVVLALPPSRLAPLLPEMALPADNAVIANAHFRIPKIDGDTSVDFIGLTNALTHWVFRRPGMISTTISAAHELGVDTMANDTLLDTIWGEVRAALGLPAALVPAARRLIKEKRATFDQSPAALALRPRAQTRFANLILAGDVVDNGLPATIEGAIRNGEAAARLCCAHRPASRRAPAPRGTEPTHA